MNGVMNKTRLAEKRCRYELKKGKIRNNIKY